MLAGYLAFYVALPVAWSQVFLPDSDGGKAISVEFPESLSPLCRSPLEKNVQCNSTLAGIAMNGYFPSQEDLSHLCTTTCLGSLLGLRAQQMEDCTSEDFIMTGGITFPPTLTIDQLLFTYNYTCIKDDSSEFCAPQIDKWLNSPDGLTAAQNCSYCFLKTLQTELNSYFGYDDEIAEEFSSLTSSCSLANYPVTPLPAYTITSPPTTVESSATTTSSYSSLPTSDCAETYTIQEGDTCHSISLRKNVSTHELLYENNLPAYCIGFPSEGSKICIPEPCEIYTLQEDDTCYKIMTEHAYAFTMSQLISWNPNINRGCSNLNQLVGDQICISFEKGVVTTVSSSAPMTTAPIPTNIAEGTNTRCAQYYQVAIDETCSEVTVKKSISLSDFYFLNPGLNSTTCNNLIPGESYCVKAIGNINTYSSYGDISQTKCISNGTIASSCLATTTLPTDTYWSFPSAVNTTRTATAPPAYSTLPVAPGTVTDCIRYEQYHNPGTNRSNAINTCDYIAYFVGIPVDELLRLNPSLVYDDSNPSNCSLHKGYRYCVKALGNSVSTSTSSSVDRSTTASGTTTETTRWTTPTPTQTGMAGSCNKFYEVVKDDGCYDIAAAKSIALDDFYKWNPAVKSNCSGLQPGFYVCVGLVSTATSTSSTGLGVATPTPTQTGMAGNCNKFYDVVKDDGCYDIAAANSVALNDFYKWNPAVKSDCSGLQPDFYVCVGISDPQ